MTAADLTPYQRAVLLDIATSPCPYNVPFLSRACVELVWIGLITTTHLRGYYVLSCTPEGLKVAREVEG